MIRFILLSVVSGVLLSCSAQTTNKNSQPVERHVEALPKQIPSKKYTLGDYLQEDRSLESKVDSIFNLLDDESIVAQLIMPAAGRLGSSPDTIKQLIKQKKIGGVLMLNGSKEQFTSWIKEFEALNSELGNLPFLYSADAEPSLVNRKIKGSTSVLKAIEIDSLSKAISTATIISNDLNDIGINYNFAPVVDVAGNKTVGYRGFGLYPDSLLPFSQAFIDETQKHNIIATAKHFPGHGLVSGDTHKALQVINGELRELKNYPPLIENGVLSIMVAHIAVTNNKLYNTNGLPATCSKEIVTDLLRDSLGFKGLIVTDAMNMGGVSNVPQASVKAIKAGCDIILMPLNPFKTHSEILMTYKKDAEFKKQVDEAAKRIIRMKICLGLL